MTEAKKEMGDSGIGGIGEAVGGVGEGGEPAGDFATEVVAALGGRTSRADEPSRTGPSITDEGYGQGPAEPSTSVLAASAALEPMRKTTEAGAKTAKSAKVTEQRAAIRRKARRRTLLDEEEGGLTPVNIYRRSILGS